MRAVLGSLCAAMLVACGPVGPFPGGRLRGKTVSAPVADWSFVSGVETCQLETDPTDPYSVNVWCAGRDGALYVPTSMIFGTGEPTERQWVNNVLADPRVRVRIGSRIYERSAVRVEDPEEREKALGALIAKYAVEPREDGQERSAWIFRLEPRGGRR